MTSECSRSLAALVMVVALAACVKPHPVQGEPPRPAAPTLFASVPADTPYLVAHLDAAPPELWARMKQVFQPLIDMVATKWQEERHKNAVLDAALTEMAGKWNEAGIESLGFSAQPRFALYGLGLQPAVLRVAVKDGKAVQATIARIAAKAGKQLPPPETRGGRTYWRHTGSDGMSMVISIADNQLIAALGKAADVDAKLGLILGLEQPARNLADGVLVQQLMARHGFGGQLIGFADTRQLGGKALEAAGASPSQACTGALDRLSAKLPRMVLGYSELSGSKITGGFVLELAPDLVADLRAIQTEVPGLGAALSGHSMLAFAAGMDLAGAQRLGVAAVDHLRQFGAACGLGVLVNGASQMAHKLSQPLGEPFDRISGGAIAVDELTFRPGDRNETPEKIEGVLLIASPDARGLFNHTLESAPMARRLGIKADGKLHDIPIPVPMFSALAAGASDHVIVVTAGGKQRGDGDKLIGARAGGKAPLFAASYDFTRIFDLGSRFRDKGPEESQPEFLAFVAALKAAFGRMSGTLDVTDHGLAIWSTLEFK